ncbi:AraC family transcriptional regulator [Thalassococcus sp. S3]|uniref:AraC family transcriptional regulator n=1 Tax=Thalassococcus sp. S3 TaxID=2017482 RepID=UPI00102468B6|nr:AraC family transcriptional regulator [Thalassococcus sp. S3]QBF33516.1 hypothetical protein CFI11_20210 [Thalassococcus sp. S3]
MSRRSEAVARAVRLIEAKLDESLPIERVAEAGYLSPFHFQRLFLDATGESVAGYIRRRRLERGANMLLAPRPEPLIQIALACGFQTHSAFSRAFRQHFGQSPSDFQRGGGAAILAESDDPRPFLKPIRGHAPIMEMDILPLPSVWLLLRPQPGAFDGVFFPDQAALGAGFADLVARAGPDLLSPCGAFERGPSAFNDPDARAWFGGLFTSRPTLGWDGECFDVPPCDWAVFMHYGPFDHLHLTWNKACRNELPAHDLEIAPGWLIETYLQPAGIPSPKTPSAQIYVPLVNSARTEQQA